MPSDFVPAELPHRAGGYTFDQPHLTRHFHRFHNGASIKNSAAFAAIAHISPCKQNSDTSYLLLSAFPANQQCNPATPTHLRSAYAFRDGIDCETLLVAPQSDHSQANRSVSRAAAITPKTSSRASLRNASSASMAKSKRPPPPAS